jgi:hypothetical protein
MRRGVSSSAIVVRLYEALLRRGGSGLKDALQGRGEVRCGAWAASLLMTQCDQAAVAVGTCDRRLRRCWRFGDHRQRRAGPDGLVRCSRPVMPM